MPTDRRGIIHAGTLGLFDDDDEMGRAVERAERHERKRLEKAMHRHDHRAGRRGRKVDGAPQPDTKISSKLTWPIDWLGRLFAKRKSLNAAPHHVKADCERHKNDGRKVRPSSTQTKVGWEVVRKPPMPTPMYTAAEIDPVDSPWLQECGMVRVFSEDAGGCRIVPKTAIQKTEQP